MLELCRLITISMSHPTSGLDIGRFSRFGPTVSAAVNQPLVGGLFAVGNFRGSLLYGQKDLNRTVVGDMTPAMVAGAPVVNLNNADEVVAAADLGSGLRYARQANNGQNCLFRGRLKGSDGRKLALRR